MPGSRLLCAALLVAVVLTAAFAGPASAAPEPFIVVFDEAAVAAAPAAQASGSVVAAGDDDDDDDDERGRKVDGRRVNRKVADLETRHKFKASNVYGALGGFAARLTAKQLRALAADATVDAVVPDVQTSLADPEGADGGIAATGISLASPRTPAGIRRVGATSSPTARINGGDQRVNVDVAILDTGIQGSHPDLNVVGGYNCTSSNRGAWGDGNGHGTHVAGTVAALDNGIGVVGVAPGARLWSVKVLNDKGTGYASWLVCGIDWVTAQKDATSAHGQRMEVVNMSLRFSLPGSDDRDCGIPSNDTVHRAICRSVAAGVTYAVAAGNESRNARVYRPAAYEEVITVSAIADYDGKPGGLARQADYCGFFSADADDSFADFSNYGADIDITAPGKCVLSTYPGSKYAYMSGTSMATPHVAGAAALYRAQFPGARPQQVKMALQHAGRLDWRTSTDPDGRPERNLWVPSYSPPPDYGVSVSTPPAGYLSTTRSVSLTVRINRTNGHNAPVSVSLRNAPTGMKVSGGPFKGAGGTVTITVAPGTAGGTHTVRVRASDGELTRGRAVNLTVDADPPAGYFSRPATGAPVVQSGTSYKIAWQEADAGSGLASRSLQRQRAVPPAAGTCAGAAWKNDGAARTAKADYTETLTTGACHRWVLTLRDNAGNSARVESGTVLVSGSGSTPPPPASAPAVTRPTVAIASSVAMTRADGARVDVTWSASVTGSNVVAHELRLSRDGGSTWSAFALPDPAQPRARLTLTAGTYVVAARAQAATGSWSSWVSSAAFRVTVVPSSDAAFTGSWQSQSVAGASGGLTRYSTQAGASAKFTFTGSSVAVVGATGPDRGQAQIFVDGAQVAVVDLRASTTSWKRVVFSRTWSRAGAHTLEVKVVGTSGRPRVDVDAYVVVGAP